MSIPLQMASDSFIQVDRISRYRSHPGLPWQKTLPVNAILKDFSLTLRQHERVGLLGCSGCGKSTLLKAILALDPVDDGEVYCDGKVVRPGSARILRWYRRRVQYLPQEPASTLPPSMRVREILNEPLRHLGCNRDASPNL
ncbi:ATP-binding cassette domain-containing protein, partial [Klebsiella pneumoniae]|nr:ATP-binding cassette domain-containing protein [Klebsiella pneumoniae]